MRNTRKILLALVLTLAFAVAMAVASYATETTYDAVKQITGSQEFETAYSDITPGNGWVQIGTDTAADAKVDENGVAKFAYVSESKAYLNETEKTLVIIGNNDWVGYTGGYGNWLYVSDGLRGNCEGKTAYLAYWPEIGTNKDKVEHIEIRGGAAFNNIAYVTCRFSKTKTLKISDTVDEMNGSKSDSAVLIGLKACGTVGHGSWASDGTFTPSTYKEGVADFTGFTSLKVSGGQYASKAVMYHGNLMAGNTAITDIILPYTLTSTTAYKPAVYVNNAWTAGTETVNPADDAFGGEYSGIIPSEMAKNATALRNVTIPAGVNLKLIEKSAFNGCTALKTVNILGTVDSELSIEAYAFDKVSGLTVNVYDNTSLANMQKALATAGVTGVTVVNASPTNIAVKPVGYSFRQNASASDITAGPALRAEFKLLADKVTAAEAEGYTLADFGVVVFSEKTLNSTAYNGDLNAIVAAVMAGQDTNKIKLVSAINRETGVQRLVRVDENGDKVFAAAITNIPDIDYTSAVYTYAYAAWIKDGNAENIEYTYTTYTSDRTGKTPHSLYDVTVYAFREGKANSQNTDADKLWPILEKGALSVTSADITALPEGLVAGYTFGADGKFTYLNQPLRKWVFNTGKLDWNSYGNYVEKDSTTNVNWSILVDGDELIVVYTAASSEKATIPGINGAKENYRATTPFCSEYFTGAQIAASVTAAGDKKGVITGSTVYTPIISQTNEDKITTLVIDYGMDSFGGKWMNDTNTSNLATIVYPEGMTVEASQILFGAGTISEIIYASSGKTSLTEDTQAEGFGKIADLSGLAKVDLINMPFSSAKKIENLILPENTTGDNSQELFKDNNALKRVWMIGSDVPAEGTLDLTKTKLKTLCKNALAGMSKVDTILMPSTFTGVSAYSMKLMEANPCASVLGADMSYKLVITNPLGLTEEYTGYWNSDSDKKDDAGGLIAYYDILRATTGVKNPANTANKDNVDKITVEYNGVTKTLAEWKANPPTVTE